MPRVRPNIVAVTVKIDGEASALFFQGFRNTKVIQSWRHDLGNWASGMINAGHTIEYDMFWRSAEPWPACGCPDIWAAPNQFSAMFAKEGAGRRLEDIRFEPYRYTPSNKKAVASFKAST